MELINTKKINNPVFCKICEKERKHILATYQDMNDSDEAFEVKMQKCKSCGTETEI